VAFASTILSLMAMYYIKRVVEQILQQDAARSNDTTNSEGLVPDTPDDASSPSPELEMPAGFARRFTPPSHALWTAHMAAAEEKKEEGKATAQTPSTKSSSAEEVVSLQDSTAGFVSGPLVDLEMMARAVVSVRKATQEETDHRKKALAESKSIEERKSEETRDRDSHRGSQTNERGSRGMTVPKKAPAEEKASPSTASDEIV